MRGRAATILACLALLTGSPGGAVPAGAGEPIPPMGPRFYRPVVIDGLAFPVARTNWFGVVEFERDWHDPRFRLIGGRWRLVGVHQGNDIFAEKATPIVAMSAGVVEAVGWTFYSGTRIGIRGDDGRYYFYAHLSQLAAGITEGARVAPGTFLGRMGNTGYGDPGTEDEFPVHLHFGLQESDEWVNPYPLLRRLYDASARSTARAETRLARLAREGRRAAHDRLAERLYAPEEWNILTDEPVGTPGRDD